MPKPAAATPAQQLAAFIAKFDAANAKKLRAARALMRKRYPTAIEMVYDNYNFFVIGYGPSERASEAVFSITGDANGIGLAFLWGATVPDPKKLLQGSGNQTRFLRVPDLALLDAPDVKKLMAAAVAQMKVPFPSTGKGKLVIKSVSAKQRPRRK
jgi:hypothetical protein